MRHVSTDGFVSFLRQHPHAKVLDVRCAHEREAGGPVYGCHCVSWYTPDREPDPAFLDQVLQRLSADDYVLVICRSGHSSWEAAALLEKSGFKHVYNVLGGFKDIRGDVRYWAHRTQPRNHPLVKEVR